ncbi:MAG: hypothetical protein ACPGTO_04715 [Polaribacter sp.]
MCQNNVKRLVLICLFLSITSCSTTVIEKVIPPPEAINYQTDIQPIVDANCTITCHSPSTQLDAGLDLSSYTSFRLATESRGVVDRIKNVSAPMPPQPNTRLTDSDIVLIEKWIADGYLEN